MSPERFKFPNPATNEAEIKRRAIASWETVLGNLELRTHNNKLNHKLLERHKVELHRYYDQVYNLKADESSKKIKQPPFESLSYHYRIIREVVNGGPEKFSKGKKIANRREKSNK